MCRADWGEVISNVVEAAFASGIGVSAGLAIGLTSLKKSCARYSTKFQADLHTIDSCEPVPRYRKSISCLRKPIRSCSARLGAAHCVANPFPTPTKFRSREIFAPWFLPQRISKSNRQSKEGRADPPNNEVFRLKMLCFFYAPPQANIIETIGNAPARKVSPAPKLCLRWLCPRSPRVSATLP